MTHRYPNESASSSSTSLKSETDDDRTIAMVLTEEYAKLDGAMAKRLTSLTSIPVRSLMISCFLLSLVPFLPCMQQLIVCLAGMLFLSLSSTDLLIE
jgi:hypothetical protein